MDNKEPKIPCTWQPESVCGDCSIKGGLMCRMDSKDMVTFLMSLSHYIVVAIGGTIVAGYGRYLWGWFVYSLFFFFVWEARVLCSHCPMWAEQGRVLYCHTNNGVIKFWKYRPGPMSRSEKAQFLVGASIWLLFPLVFMLMGQAYFLSLIMLTSTVSAVYSISRLSCTRCINFSCPMNAVPKGVVDAYLKRNPVMLAAWEKDGYILGRD